jgi:hypothetical protein
MSKCPHCGKILSDNWVKHEGASLLGKSGKKRKARSTEVARDAALKRWENSGRPIEEQRVAARRAKQREYHRRWRERHPERWAQLQADNSRRRKERIEAQQYEKLGAEIAAEVAQLGKPEKSDELRHRTARENPAPLSPASVTGAALDQARPRNRRLYVKRRSADLLARVGPTGQARSAWAGNHPKSNLRH